LRASSALAYRFPYSAPAGPGVRSTYFTTDTCSDPRYRSHWVSARECQVLKLLVDGRTSKEIAAIMGVKPSGIDTYRSRIMAKPEINDIASLVRLAIRHSMIRP
jgi:DNA-binding CsgD family transcriptional regulator